MFHRDTEQEFRMPCTWNGISTKITIYGVSFTTKDQLCNKLYYKKNAIREAVVITILNERRIKQKGVFDCEIAKPS